MDARWFTERKDGQECRASCGQENEGDEIGAGGDVRRACRIDGCAPRTAAGGRRDADTRQSSRRCRPRSPLPGGSGCGGRKLDCPPSTLAGSLRGRRSACPSPHPGRVLARPFTGARDHPGRKGRIPAIFGVSPGVPARRPRDRESRSTPFAKTLSAATRPAFDAASGRLHCDGRSTDGVSTGDAGGSDSSAIVRAETGLEYGRSIVHPDSSLTRKVWSPL